MWNITVKNSSWEVIKTIPWDINKTLLKQLEDNWVEMHSACLEGICWACMCKIESWEENINKKMKTEPGFPLWDDEVMTCIAWLKNDQDIVLKTIY